MQAAPDPLSGLVLTVVIVAIVAGAVVSALVALRRRPSSAASRAVVNLPVGLEMARVDGELKALRDKLDTLSSSIPHTNEVGYLKEGMEHVNAQFASLSSTVNESMETFRRTSAEDFDKTRRAMEKAAIEKVAAEASAILEKNGVPRSEFDALRERFDRMHGADETEERMGVLARIFDSDKIKVLNWQCRLIRLLKGGLAPDAEQDLMLSEGIPASTFRSFLKRLEDEGIAESKSVRAYYMDADHEWIYTYADRPDWLQRRLQGTVKREADYNRYVRANVGLVEDGLILEDSEYRLDTGRLDLVCRDASGRAVGIELKYPAAAVRDKRQVASYRDDYRRKSAMPNSRFMLVAPRIPDELKRLLAEDGIEHREIPLGGGSSPDGGGSGGGSGSGDGQGKVGEAA